MKRHSHATRIMAVFALCTLILDPALAYAGGGPSLKAKVQKRIRDKRNFQYQTDENRPQRSAGGFQVDRYDPSRGLINLQAEADTPTSVAVHANYTVYETHYMAELEDNVVTILGKAVFEVIGNNSTYIPLLNKDIGLIDVKLNRGTAFVTLQGDMYYLKIDKPGKYTLNFEYLIKASRERENGPGQFAFQVMPAPIAQFEFTMPEAGMEVFIEPSIKTEQKNVANKTNVWAILPHTSLIKTRWSKALPKEDIKQVKLEPKVYAESSTYATIGNGIVHSQTQINYSILQSEVTNLRLSVPEDVNILDVKGKDLRDWKITLDKGFKYLDVYLNYGLKGAYLLDVSYERSIGSGSVVAQIPTIKPLGVEREFGYVGIAAKTSVELDVNKLNRATKIDAKELPNIIRYKAQSPILLAFKFVNHPFDIVIDVTRHREVPVLIATVDKADYLTLHTEQGHVLTRATYFLRNNVKQFLRVNIPEGATLWSAFVANKPVKPAEDKDGRLLIPLLKSQTQGQSLSQFPVEVVYLQEGSALGSMGQLQMQLPQLDLPISEVNWATFLPEEFSYFRFKGDLKFVKDQSSWSTHSLTNQFISTAAQTVSRFNHAFAQRSLQARVLDASTYLNTHAAVGNVNQYEPYYMSNQYSPGNAEQQLGAQEGQRIENHRVSQVTGSLPIKIHIPKNGQLLTFTRMLVVPEEIPQLTFHYTVWVKRTAEGMGYLAVTGLLVMIVLFGASLIHRIRHRIKKVDDITPELEI